MTSNLGSQHKKKETVMEDVRKHFRPEFINRIDEIVVFHSLDHSQIREITNIQINSLRKKLLDKDLFLDISDNALDYLAEAGFDPVYGARPLKRAIQQYLENPIAQSILQGKFMPKDNIIVTKNGKNLIIK
ncbi:MAG: ATP-dependent Clp protease ATP-binding subunit ClpB [uncultured bacterium]|nr:MAG: ATP-dependent Clp protease ATP-binding subunit ClpB [uncultured bacterium]